MKHIIKINLLCLLLILLVLSLHSVNAARVFISSELPPAAAAHDHLSGISKVNAIPRKVGHEGNTADHNNPWQLMGMEECKSGDEECEKRRLLSEAHLDYIYTQVHHKP